MYLSNFGSKIDYKTLVGRYWFLTTIREHTAEICKITSDGLLCNTQRIIDSNCVQNNLAINENNKITRHSAARDTILHGLEFIRTFVTVHSGVATKDKIEH